MTEEGEKMSGKKLCPLFSIANVKGDWVECLEFKCAFYTRGECSFVKLVEELDNLRWTLEDGAYKLHGRDC